MTMWNLWTCPFKTLMLKNSNPPLRKMMSKTLKSPQKRR